MKENFKKELWLLLSGFGIMFAVLSWCQESNIMPSKLDSLKGFLALTSGFFLYISCRKKL